MSRMFKPHSHIPYGEAGNYGKSLHQQYQEYLSPVKDVLIAAIESIPNEGHIFTLGDYGTADGATTMFLMKDIIDAIRKKYGEEMPIEVVYEDQPSNDFNGLMKRVHGLIPEPRSYLPSVKNVFTFVNGTSFYDLCVPEGSMDFIMSFAACQWLSKRATVYRDSFYRMPVASQEEREAVAKQGAEDWEQFLLMRAKELKTGGILAVTLSVEREPENEGQPAIAHQLLVSTYLSVWTDFRKRGRITADEFVNTNFNLIARTKAELEAPFVSPDSRVRSAGLTLVILEIVQMQSWFTKEWKKKLETDGVDDRIGFATEYVNSHRCWSNSVFVTGLSDKRTESEKEGIVDDFYREVTKELAKHRPDNPLLDTLGGFVMARKVESNDTKLSKL